MSEKIEVIRCKDCKYQKKFMHPDRRYKEGGIFYEICTLIDEYAESLGADESYCSNAERKETNND